MAATAIAVLFLGLSAGTVGLTQPATADSYIVVTDRASDEIRGLIARLGGTVTLELGLVSGFAADLSPTAVSIISSHPDVVVVTPDRSLSLSGKKWEANDSLDQGSLTNINGVIDATKLWKRGATGQGVDIALIDSGVAPVQGLAGGKVVNGPDISFDSALPNLQNLDFYGHGTHMASIMAGNDGQGNSPSSAGASFYGVAPNSRVVNVKVANAIGLADVSQVIAAIDWVVQHRRDSGMNIRVLALAFGTDSTQDYRIDPLSMAVEQAWRSGIVVVTAAGNDGNAAALRNPATNPYVIAVGAVETQGTANVKDDVVLSFSNCGTSRRSVDLVAPGRSVLGLRVPGSYIDSTNPTAVVNERYFRGSGTSQATAVVAGAAALLISERPRLTPDQVKNVLTVGAVSNRNNTLCHGAGLLNVAASANTRPGNAHQSWDPSDGSGSLELARGSHHVSFEGVELTGEEDWLGGTWSGGTWSGGTWSGGTWSGGTWSGGTWSGGTWSGGTWSGGTWSGGTWSGGTWSGGTWSGGTWSGGTWSGGTWSGGTWSGNSWSGNSWSTASWN